MIDDFDWVTAYTKCTADMMLAVLEEGIRRDVEKRNELGKEMEPRFTVESRLDESKVVVHKSEPADKENHAQVMFHAATTHMIIVTGDGGIIKVRVNLDSTGQCGMTLTSDEAPISKVELRMKALGPLFFRA